MLRDLVHYGIHFIVPLVVAVLFFRRSWLKAYCIMLLGILIDLDHLLTTPIFDPYRCSINFHPLHSYYLIPVYAILAILKKTRWIGLGLVIHIIADAMDCSLI